MNAPTFLVDEDRCIGAPYRIAEGRGERQHALGRLDIAAEDDEPPRIRVAEERDLVVGQARAGASGDEGARRHEKISSRRQSGRAAAEQPSLLQKREVIAPQLLATKHTPPAATSREHSAVASSLVMPSTRTRYSVLPLTSAFTTGRRAAKLRREAGLEPGRGALRLGLRRRTGELDGPAAGSACGGLLDWLGTIGWVEATCVGWAASW